MKLGGIYISVGAKTTKLALDLKKAEGMAKKTAVLMNHELGSISMGAATIAFAALAAGTTMATSKIVSLGREFESTMKTVQAWSGATGKSLENLNKIAREMGATTEHTATQAAGALKFLAAAGFSAEQSIAALPGTLDLATAAQVDLSLATDITTDTMTAFGMKVEDLSRVNDAFIVASTGSNTTVEMLGESMRYAAPMAKLMGYNVEQTAAMLGALAGGGIKASMAGAGLNMIMLKSAQYIKTAGIEGMTFIDLLKLMKKEQWDAAKIGKVFGARQVKTADVLASQIPLYEKLHKKMQESAGITQELADVMRDSLDNDIKVLNSTIEEELLRTFDDYNEYMRDIVQSTTEWIRTNPEAIDQFAEMARNMFEAGAAMAKVISYAPAFINAFADIAGAAGLASTGLVSWKDAIFGGVGVMKLFETEIGRLVLQARKLQQEIAALEQTDNLLGPDPSIAKKEAELKKIATQINKLNVIIEETKALTFTIDKNTPGFEKWNTSVEDVNKNLKKTKEALTEIEQELLDEKILKALDKFFGEIENHMTEAEKIHAAMVDTWEEEELRKIEATIANNEKIAEESEQALKDLEKLRQEDIDDQIKAYEHMWDNIHDVMSDFWNDALDGQMNSWDDFMDYILDTFKKTFSEILAAASTDIVMNVVMGVSGGSTSSSGGITGQISDAITKKLGSSIFDKIGSYFGGSVAGNGISTASMSSGIGAGQLGGVSSMSGWASTAMMGSVAALGGFVISKLFEAFTDSTDSAIAFLGADITSLAVPGIQTRDEPSFETVAPIESRTDSALFDYGFSGGDFNDEPVQAALIEYFDAIFTALDEVTESSINDVLKDFTNYSFTGAPEDISSGVFSDMLGSMLVAILPDEGTIEETVSQMIGGAYQDYDPFNNTSSFGRDFENQQASETMKQIYQPIYKDVTQTVSKYAETFNEAFFDAIMPEGGNEWDSLISFAETVQSTDDFISKFDTRMQDFGLTAIDAYNQILFVTGSITELNDIANSFGLAPISKTIEDLMNGFVTLNTALIANNATVDELADAYTNETKIMWGTVVDASGESAGMINTMSDAVKNIIWSSDQLKMQDIASQGEQIKGFFNDIYDSAILAGDPGFIAGAKALVDGVDVIVNTLMSVQALDIYKGHLETIGGMKAGVYGLEDEFKAMQIGSKYGAQLGTAQEQAAFVKSVLGMSTTEFITATEYFGVSVNEAASDIETLAGFVKETSDAFEDIESTIGDTIKSLEEQFGMGNATSLSSLMKDFNKAAGDAMSSDSLIAMAGAEKLPGLSTQILTKALADAPTSYEYQKVYAKIIGTMENVEGEAGDQVKALSLVDINSGNQLTELENINGAIGLTNIAIDSLLTDGTFVKAYTDFNTIWNNGAVFNTLNSTLISLTGVISGLTGTANPITNVVTNPVTGQTGPASVSDPSQWKTWQLKSTPSVSGESESSLLNKYGISGASAADISNSLNEFKAMDFAGQEVWAEYYGTDIGSMGQDINQLKAYGYADGGISTGPVSGYPVTLHGTEAVIPIGGSDIPLIIKNDYSKGILSEIKILRKELKHVNSVNSLKIKKIKQTLDKVTAGNNYFATKEEV